jgi:hypothetical protein
VPCVASSSEAAGPSSVVVMPVTVGPSAEAVLGPG